MNNNNSSPSNQIKKASAKQKTSPCAPIAHTKPHAQSMASSFSIDPVWTAPPRQHITQQSSSSTSPSSNDTQANLLHILTLERIDTNLFRGYSPEVPRWGRIYGGQTVSQALVASTHTVSPPFLLHSLHSYFLRPGDDELPILYSVDRLKDGCAFVHRRVTASQNGQAIFAMNVSYHRPESEGQLTHADTMPSVPSPTELPSLAETLRAWSESPRLSKRIRLGILRSSSFPFPIELRRVDNYDIDLRLSRSEARQRAWMKVHGNLGDSLILHQCALAYMSDWSLLETACLPHGIHTYQNNERQQLQMASLDHSMWFHSAFRADEWLLYSMTSPRAGGGRGLTMGQFFRTDGVLAVTCSQEGLIRLRIAPKDPYAKPPAAAEKSDTNKHKETDAAASSTTENGDNGLSSHITVLPSNL